MVLLLDRNAAPEYFASMIQKFFTLVFAVLIWGNSWSKAAEFSLSELGSGFAVDINNSGVVALNDADHGYRVVNGVRTEIFGVIEIEGAFTNRVASRIIRIGDGGQFLLGAFQVGTIGFYQVVGSQGDLLYSTFYGVELLRVSGINSTPAFSLLELGGEPRCSVISLGTAPGYVVKGYWRSLSDLNDAGVATGVGAEASLLRSRAIRVTAGVTEYLDSRPPGEPPINPGNPVPPLSEGIAINEAGHVVGRFAPVVDGPQHAFRFVGNGLEDLGTLGGVASEALDITDNGWIVGQSQRADGEWRPFLWRDGVMVDLNTLLPAGLEVELLTVSAINNVGSMVGSARFGNMTNAYLLNPSTLVQAPRIDVQPRSRTVALGATVTLSVTVQGGLPMSYQWLRSGAAIPGETNSTLVLTNVTAFSQGGYRVQITNAGGSVASDEAVVTVLDPKLATVKLVGVTLEGEVGAQYVIEYTPAINPTTWQVLETVVLTNSPMTYVDMASSTNGIRIYRAIRLP